MAVDMGSAVAHLLLDTAQFNQALGESQSGLSGAGKIFSSVGATLTGTVTKGFVSAGKAAFGAASEFESAMSQIQATRGITSEAMEELNGEAVNTMDAYAELAKYLGSTTKFSATEAADAINNMAMAGYSLQETYDVLPTVLSLASAGNLDLAYATQIVANGLNAMGLETENAAELSDKLAVTASNAYGSVSDFGEGLMVVGGQAQLCNLSLTDTMTALGILGDNGISAAEGGTMLRNVLKNLYTPTDDAAEALQELGVTTVDENGNLKDFQTILQELGVALDGLSEEDRVKAMARIFDTRTIAGANALLADSGERWNELSEAIDDSGGAADRMANTQLDNMQGRLTILKSSIEGLLISLGELLLPVIEKIVAVVQKVVDWLNSLDDGTKETLLKIAAIAAALGPVLTIIGRIIGLIQMITTVVSALGPVISAIGAVLSGPVGIIAAIVVGVIALIEFFKKLYNECEGFRNFVDSIVAWIKQAFYDIGEFFVETLPEWIRSAIEWFKNLPTAIADALSNAYNAIATWVANVWSSLVNGIKDIVNTVVQFFSELVQKIASALSSAASKVYEFIKSVIKFYSELPGKIWDWLVKAYDKVTTWISNVAQKMKIGIQDAIAAVVKFFSELPGKIWSWLVEAFNSIVQWVSDTYQTMVNGVKGMVDGIVGWISSIPDKFREWFGNAIAYLKSINLLQIGKDIMNSLFDGLKNIWNGIKNWFSGLKLNWGKLKDGANDVKGSYSTGLDFVPRTMAVTVHRGERILTQQENEDYNRGGSVEVVTYQNDEAIRGMSETMDKLLSEVERIKEMRITLDGKRLVGGLVNEMDRQLGIRAERAR